MEKEEKRPYFSIVMPAYGVEAYIERAIKSIQKQSFTDWELIVVDDCSPDQSGAIAEAFAAEDGRIRVIRHEENEGLSSARNTGEAEASGRYIWYMDSDDYVDLNLLEQVYESVEKNPAKLIVFGLLEEYYEKDGTYSYAHAVKPKEGYYVDKESLRREIIYLEQATLYGYAWNKMYELEYLRSLQLKYENVKLIEDILFNVKYCKDIDSMNLLAITPYHYQKRLDSSLTNKFVPDYYRLHKRRIKLIYEQYCYWELCTEEVKQILGSLYGRYILSALQRNCDKRSGMNHFMRCRWCRSVFGQQMFQQLIPYAKASDSKALAAALKLMKGKHTILCLMMGRAVYIIKEKMPMVYSKVKSER